MTDWKEGDLAVCIADGWHKGWVYNPKAGDVLRVTKCGLFAGEMALAFEGKHLRQGWNALAFRKAVRDDRPAEMRFCFEMIGVSHAVKSREARA